MGQNDPLENRVQVLELQMTQTRLDVVALTSQLAQNTKLTEAVKADTSEISEAVKGFKVLGKFARWLGWVAAGLAVIAAFFKGVWIGDLDK